MKAALGMIFCGLLVTSCGGSGSSFCLSFDGSDFGGNLTIEGTISTPNDVSAGKSTQMTVTRVTGGDGNLSLLQTSGNTCEGGSTYQVTGMTPGTYRIRLRVNVDGNNRVDDAVDLDGYYDGSVESPKSFDEAETITLSSDSLENIDFGVAANGS